MTASVMQRGCFSLLLAGAVALGACRTKPKAKVVPVADLPVEENALGVWSARRLSKPAERPTATELSAGVRSTAVAKPKSVSSSEPKHVPVVVPPPVAPVVPPTSPVPAKPPSVPPPGSVGTSPAVTPSSATVPDRTPPARPVIRESPPAPTVLPTSAPTTAPVPAARPTVVSTLPTSGPLPMAAPVAAAGSPKARTEMGALGIIVPPGTSPAQGVPLPVRAVLPAGPAASAPPPSSSIRGLRPTAPTPPEVVESRPAPLPIFGKAPTHDGSPASAPVALPPPPKPPVSGQAVLPKPIRLDQFFGPGPAAAARQKQLDQQAAERNAPEEAPQKAGTAWRRLLLPEAPGR